MRPVFILICLVYGVAVAHLAAKNPSQRTLMENISGVLIVVALGTIGFCVPFFR
jgi:hypothetical protein